MVDPSKRRSENNLPEISCPNISSLIAPVPHSDLFLVPNPLFQSSTHISTDESNTDDNVLHEFFLIGER